MVKKYSKKIARKGKKTTKVTTIRRSVRYTRGKRRMGIPKSNYPLGMSHVARLRYVEGVSLDPAALSNGSYIFNASSIYDPNVTGIGHQPYGFDQLMAMYNHYTVIGAKITVKLSASAGQSAPYWAGILLRDSSTANSTSYGTNYLLEQPGARYKLIPYGNQSGTVVTLTNKYSAKKFFKKSTVVEDALLRGDNGGNPVESAYFHVIVTPYNDSTDNISLQYMTVTIDYIAVFTEPKMLGPS